MESERKGPLGSRARGRSTTGSRVAVDDRTLLECRWGKRLDLPGQHALAGRDERFFYAAVGASVLSKRVHTPHRNETLDESSYRFCRSLEQPGRRPPKVSAG